ncbi:thioredoxin fold domain-containing protein [Candidatus Halobeggiatoa sp. HSG11]|nr:thioredoxin fold domain-containing protein [Candidatus Halobeggiatoa sp. HSG11]
MRIYFFMMLLAISSFALAEVDKATDTQADKIPTAVTDALKKFAKVDIDKIKLSSTPIKGVYEALIGSEVIYLSGDGKYLIMGEIRDLATGKNITDNKLSKLRRDGLKTVNVRDMVVFAPENEVKHVVSIFTDVDCPYCSKIHNEVPALNKAGIEVRYLAFPRAGVGSGTYNEMVSVWCAKDKQKAMTDAKAGQEIDKAECNNPVADQYKLGQRIGISGTPAIVLSDGELVPGYLPAARLINYLDQKFKVGSTPFKAK